MADTVSLHKPPRMRGIKQAIDELKLFDPDTALTEHALRQLIVSKSIPSVRCGTKYLISMETLENYLYEGSCSDRANSTDDYGKIREIKER